MALCFCCQEPYNKSTRALVRCDQYKSDGAGVKECGFETCRTCVRRYLLGHTSAGPHCMNCKSLGGAPFFWPILHDHGLKIFIVKQQNSCFLRRKRRDYQKTKKLQQIGIKSHLYGKERQQSISN